MKKLLLLAALCLHIPVDAATVTGKATVVDGDSLEISGRKLRLFGIDAPEGPQICERDAQAWACGEAAAEQLRALLATGSVSCSGNEFDQYSRLLVVCTSGAVEVNRQMVAQGWATAYRRYSDAYVPDEDAAHAAKLGLWASNFTPPEVYRMAEDKAAPRAEPVQRVASSRATGSSSCAIKGNRNTRGEWIYHLPGAPYYAQTNAEEVFCTEAEARAAGYRASRARRE